MKSKLTKISNYKKSASHLALKTAMAVCAFCTLPSAVAHAGTVSLETIQQNGKAVQGTVFDSNKEPLIGVTILIKGTNQGTVTDFDGKFEINASKGDILVVSYIGMRTQEIQVTDKGQYQITLESDTELLDEVVVTGYQTLSKERSTGSFAKVSTKVLETKRMDNLSSMLEGRVAGYVDGKIRGITTMNAVANPLVVIDGFPVENTSMNRTGVTTESMPDLNPEDIESVTVLKDAAAVSIYGTRAANGVIVITTKKAKEGKAEVSFSSTFTMQPYSYFTGNLTNAEEVIALERTWAAQNPKLLAGGASADGVAADIRDNGGLPSQGVDVLLNMYTHKIGMDEGNALLNQLASTGYRYYDQIDKYMKRNPFYQQYNLRVGKATERNSFNLSTSYWDNKYEDVNSNDKKLGINLNNTLNVTSWLQADLGVYLKYGEEKSQYFDPFNPGFTYLPYDALVASDGSYVSAPSQNKKDRRGLIEQYGLRPEIITPMAELNRQLGKNKVFESRVFGKLKFDFTNWLNYNVMFQYETSDGKLERLRERDSYDVVSLLNNFTSLGYNNQVMYNLPEGDILYSNDNTKRSYNFRQQLNVNKRFNDKHDLVWILGQEVRHSKIEYFENSLYGYDPELLTWPAINEKDLANFSGILGTAQLDHNNMTTKRELVNRFVSFYTNASYTFDDRYVLSTSIRWDRSNLWGTSSKYQNKPLWSVGGSWNIDRESFFKVPFIDMLKLRASYGIGGNIGRNTAPYLIAQYFASSIAPGLTGVVVSPPNKDIRWEKTGTVNVGFDFAMFKNRLSGSFDFYNKKSVDLLANINGSPTQGFGYAILTTNNGAMLNRGFELSLRGDIIRKKDFNWTATLLYSLNKNEVKKISVKAPNYDSRLTMPTSYPVVGKPLNGIYAYEWAGLNEQGDPQVYDAQGNITSKDVRDADAIKYQGTSIPVHSGSLTNILQYKDFEFSAMLIFSAGHKIRDTFTPAISMGDGRVVSTHKDIMNRWQKPGDEHYTNVPRLLFTNDTENYNSYRDDLYSYSNLFVYNASNIRINNISLAYRIPHAICKKAFLSSAKLQFNVENVATIAFDNRAHYALGGKVKPNFVWGLYLNF